ncbi:SGNH/GDSL hydrolase family protein [Streptomyces fuscichromogenes]|uniref:Lipase n=1 Tax=Streptomyces fuscichromogenes TaxID=1324013 RepID=A0A918CX84_9ACTN|nr:SGNH/GDSL hydrolase family protein [Streptomyces fuscichromogenes]GGN44026.1 lipase [Streptomyces fuscichromogenes]
MTTPDLRIVTAGVLVAVGVLAAAVGLTHDAGDDRPAASVTWTKGPYVALGDSYTAGPDIPGRHGTPVGCARSDHNYPSLVAGRLGVSAADFSDMSCTGATVADLTAPQHTGNGTNPAQLTALSRKTRLVSLGIGGNDIGFGAIIERCVAMGAVYHALGSGKFIAEDAPCERLYTEDGGEDQVERKIDAAGTRLADALGEIGRRAPQARVYVVGYPDILSADSSACRRDMSLAPGDTAYLREKEQRLNTELRERAEAAGAVYVDTYGPSKGHDACADEDTRWIEPLLPSSAAAAVHPNARGERGMADAVLRALR